MLTKEDNLMYPYFCVVKETYYLKIFCKAVLTINMQCETK